MAGTVRLDVEGAIATITNDNPDKHNAFDDVMDAELFSILRQLRALPDVRAIVWRGEGKSWSSGRDVSAIGTNLSGLSHPDLMRRGHQGIQQLWELDAPVIVAGKGWVMGGSFQRALLCDLRIATPDTRFRLPELTHGVIPDTGGVAVLHQIAGPGVVADMVLTGRVMHADEALHHGIISRVVEEGALDAVAQEMATAIAAAPKASVKLARQVLRNLSVPQVRGSMLDEQMFQTTVSKSDDFAEFKAARVEGREPRYSGS